MAKTYISRKIESALKKRLKQYPAVAITGPRQSGKTTLVRETLKSFNYVTLDDPLSLDVAINDPELFLDNHNEPLIIDEIQYAPQLLRYIKMRIDKDRDKIGRFVLTGSQQFHLMKNLGETLAGRIGLLNLFPFSVIEKRNIKGQRIIHAKTRQAFFNCCLRGSFPEPSIKKGIEIVSWYASLFQTYLERDIRSIFDIGNLRSFQACVKLLASRCSQVLNMSTISKDIGVSVNTIKKWISILEASGVIYLLPPYYVNLGKRVTKSPKMYFLDVGFVCYLTGIRTEEHILSGPMAGALFENFILQETLKVIYHRGFVPSLYYFRTHNNLEVDLLIEEPGSLLHPLEIKLSQTPSVFMANNLERFFNLMSKLKIQKAKILSLSEKEFALSKTVHLQRFSNYLHWLSLMKH